MLKPDDSVLVLTDVMPAAFGRLRVETIFNSGMPLTKSPAAFGRLRVETFWIFGILNGSSPAAFGRLRVETS